MKILTVLAILLGVYWAKNKFLSPKIAEPIEIFPSRGVTFVKRTLKTYSSPTVASANENFIRENPNTLAVASEVIAEDDLQSHVQAAPLSEKPVAESSKQVAENMRQELTNPRIPEDSVLKRHFMSQLQTEIEIQVGPCPSDATLKRHYSQRVQSKIHAYLAEA